MEWFVDVPFADEISSWRLAVLVPPRMERVNVTMTEKAIKTVL